MKTRWGAGAVSTSMKTRKTDQRWCHYCSRGLFWGIASLQINYNYQVPGSLPNEDDTTMGQWDFILDCTICWYWQDLVIVNHSHNLVWLSCIHKLYLDILSEDVFWKQGEIVFWGNRNVGLQTSYWGGRGSKLRCRQNILYFLQNPSKCCDFVKSKSIVPCPPSPLP